MAWDLTDSYGRKTGRVDDDGRITDEYGRKIGTVDSDGRIRDEYGRTTGWRNSDGRLTDEYGYVTGHVHDDGRITDRYGRTEGHYSESSGGCYLTTACVGYRGMADDCEILTKLRAFRDGYMASRANGREDIERYYDVAPRIVESIDGLDEDSRRLAYDGVFEVISKCITMIDAGDYEGAYSAYKAMALGLEAQFC